MKPPAATPDAASAPQPDAKEPLPGSLEWDANWPLLIWAA